MGPYIQGTVTGANAKSRTVKFLIDSGAVYSLLPTDVWQELQLKPKRKLTFTLADGTEIERNVSECHFSLSNADGHSPVILGEPGDDALVGAVTLETLGLVLNPFNRTLQPMLMRLG
jgi:predicted aspartyl protease